MWKCNHKNIPRLAMNFVMVIYWSHVLKEIGWYFSQRFCVHCRYAQIFQEYGVLVFYASSGFLQFLFQLKCGLGSYISPICQAIKMMVVFFLPISLLTTRTFLPSLVVIDELKVNLLSIYGSSKFALLLIVLHIFSILSKWRE